VITSGPSSSWAEAGALEAKAKASTSGKTAANAAALESLICIFIPVAGLSRNAPTGSKLKVRDPMIR
jgi:hypothetical protein